MIGDDRKIESEPPRGIKSTKEIQILCMFFTIQGSFWGRSTSQIQWEGEITCLLYKSADLKENSIEFLIQWMNFSN